MSKVISTNIGVSYTLTLQVDMGTAEGLYIMPRTTNGGNIYTGTNLAQVYVTSSGTHTVTFTASTSTTQLLVEKAGTVTQTFYVDNVKVEQSTPTLTSYPIADVVSAQHYYPFGSTMQTWEADGKEYVFGFGGQEKDNEVAGTGNSYTAEFWQYDSRLGRRFNIDPIVKPWESPYATFSCNPIYYSDPSGADPVGPPNDPEDPPTKSDGVQLSEVEIKAPMPTDQLVITKHFKEANVWQNFIGWLTGVEAGIRGDAYWTFGVQFNTKDGVSNGNTANPVAPENFKNILKIDNWDEVSDLLDILGVTTGLDALNNRFQTYEIKRPKGLSDFNKLRSMNKGKGNNTPIEASKRFKTLQSNIDVLNKTYKNQFPGSSTIGNFNVNARDVQTPVLEKVTFDTIIEKGYDTSGTVYVKYNIETVRKNGIPIKTYKYAPSK